VDLTELGVWPTRRANRRIPDIVVELERAGYGALWLGGARGDNYADFDKLLSVTDSIVVATGIVNIWQYDPVTVADVHKRLVAAYPQRFLLGIGVGHPEVVAEYRSPYEALVDYLDALDGAGVPAEQRAVAALGPRVLRLSAARSAGAHPYLTSVEHTREAREIIGPGTLLAPELTAVLETDPTAARAAGRAMVSRYMRLTNYVTNWRRLGFGTDEVIEPGSDRLIDALVAHGDEAAIVRRVREHLDAGADHVCIQLLESEVDEVEGYQRIAEEFARTS
jgi:probable F420-dependent oxidoreductase